MARSFVQPVMVMAVLALMSHPAAAIVNGARASEAVFAAQFPWAVALVNAKSGGVCTGQLIAPEWVLTAAHCAGTGMTVVVGSGNRKLKAHVAGSVAARREAGDPR